MTKMMTVALLQGPHRFSLEERPIPVPGPDEILVRTTSCGICTSEIEIWKGKLPDLEYPRFIGHEPSGIVEHAGAEVSGFAPGDHVAVWSEGKAYAEYFVSKADYAFRLRHETNLEEALGEPIACSVNGVRKLDPQLNDSVCIVGCGFMGLIMVQIFRARGAGTVIAVDTRKSIRDLSLRLGATHAMDPAETDVAAAVKDLTGGRGVDIGVEAAGLQATLDLTGQVVRMEGKLEVFGFHVGEPRAVPWGFWNWMAFTIVNGPVRSPRMYVEGMTTGLTMLEAGTLKMGPLVTHRFPLREIDRAFQVAAAKDEGFVKGIITE
ncbi:MAG: zinc-binding dehydrogenase [Bacteroidetes bacterium]|nr:zinc-binding dehydrogenase [Bacteroidota bacterium]